jgi:hypothetical protein
MDETQSWLRRWRAHAGYHDCHDKPLKDFGIIVSLLKGLNDPGTILRPGPCPRRAPGLIAMRPDGQLSAFEVVALVSASTVWAAQRFVELQGRVVARLDEAETISAIEDLLHDKDARIYHGGPYAEIKIVIHTDEAMLRTATTIPVLLAHEFGPYSKLTGAYVVFSYNPRSGSCDFVRLRFRA